ncbi:Ribosomal large subunit pseudouridine synthase F [compost metagenome]
MLTEGKNRQIRRMCEVFGYRVVRLRRVRIMNINLGDLANGRWRDLHQDELDELFQTLRYEPQDG